MDELGTELGKVATEMAVSMGGWRSLAQSLLDRSSDEGWDAIPVAAEARYQLARRRLRRRRRGRAVIDLLDRAHASVPFSPIFVMPDPLARGTAVLSAHRSMLDLVGEKGEGRARRLWQTMGMIAETVYRPHVERLWRLQRFADGLASGKAPRFGTVTDCLVGAGQQHLLVNRYVAKFRNGALHGRVTYDPGTRLSRFSDDGDWTQELCTRDIAAMADAMLSSDELLNEILTEFMLWAIGSNMSRVVQELVLALRIPDGSFEAMEAEYQKCWQQIAAPTSAAFQKYRAARAGKRAVQLGH